MATFDLTFTDWDNYTDGNGTARTLDWTAPSMKGQFCYPFIDALRKALNERMVISHRGINRDPYVLPALTVRTNATAWIEYVLKSCIYYLRTRLAPWNMSDSRAFLTWVAPGTLPTLVDQTYYTYPTALRAGAYCGLYGNVLNWEEAQTRLLDAAGVLDPTFRAWWLKMSGLYGWPIETNLLYPNAYLVWALKKMISQLVRSVADYRSGSSWEYIQLVSSEYRYVVVDWTNTADLNAAFNASPAWVEGTCPVQYVPGYWSWADPLGVATHGAKQGLGSSYWSWSGGSLDGKALVTRNRNTFQFPTHDLPISNGEYGFMFSWGYTPAGVPALITGDFPEVTVGYDGPWQNYIICHPVRSYTGEDVSGEVYMTGDYGDSIIPTFVPPPSQPYNVAEHGWRGGPWTLHTQDWNVPGGFTFR